MIEIQKALEGQTADGRFPLIELVGATQHSSVFRTEHEDAPNRQAAIKLIPAPATTAGAQLTRWRLAARFSHPALLRIFDRGRCDFEGRPMLYVVMELAEENLADILPVRSLSTGEADLMLGPVLDALRYLHEKGFVHGHLQPSNILAIGDQVKLSSDSIARIAEVADNRDPRDPYNAPEISLSAASDVWSLGITLAQCLTGRVPERDPEGRNSVVVSPEVPAPFLDLAQHCLNPVPQRRWSVTHIQSALAHGTSTAVPVQPTELAAQPEPLPVSVPAVKEASAFSKPDAVAPLRRRFRLKKQYRLVLAAAAAAAAAFVLGVVISGGGSETTVTASAPVTTVAENSRPSATPDRPMTPRAKEPRSAGSRETSADKSPETKTRRDKAPSAQLALSRDAIVPRPTPAVIVSSTPAQPTEPSAPVSGDVIPGAVSRQATPRVPASASNTIWGTVRVAVIVDVDARGHVVEAKLDSPGPSRYFANLSLAASKDWKFAPPRVHGNVVPSEWVIDFGYTKTDTSATASEKHP